MDPSVFITVSYSGNPYRAVLRKAVTPWQSYAVASSTESPLAAAEAAARKAGYASSRFMLERVDTTQWTDATNGYLKARRVSAIAHIYRIVRRSA